MPRPLLIIDDDPLSREVLALLAEEANLEPLAVNSGEAALAHLALHPAYSPSALLIDMQMPGLSGDPLALRLRGALSSSGAPSPSAAPSPSQAQSLAATPILVAISGTSVAPAQRLHFDAFLLKPFTFATFLAALADAPEMAVSRSTPSPVPPEALSQATYQVLAQSMPPAQLDALYAMLLADADRRILLMRQALADADRDAWCRAAHAIKGGCGMVGALELASLAAAMEDDGPPPEHRMVDHFDPFADFQAAAARLRSILSSRPPAK